LDNTNDLVEFGFGRLILAIFHARADPIATPVTAWALLSSREVSPY